MTTTMPHPFDGTPRGLPPREDGRAGRPGIDGASTSTLRAQRIDAGPVIFLAAAVGTGLAGWLAGAVIG